MNEEKENEKRSWRSSVCKPEREVWSAACDQQNSFVLCAPHGESEKCSAWQRCCARAQGWILISAAPSPLRAANARGVLPAAEVLPAGGFGTTFITFDALMCNPRCSSCFVHHPRGYRLAPALLHTAPTRPLRFWGLLSGIDTGFWQLAGTERVLNPCPAFLSWPWVFLWMRVIWKGYRSQTPVIWVTRVSEHSSRCWLFPFNSLW